jgi:hypothetical protein
MSCNIRRANGDVANREWLALIGWLIAGLVEAD